MGSKGRRPFAGAGRTRPCLPSNARYSGSNAMDLAMVLAVDGSASVSYDEFGLIAGGMAAALRDPAVAAGLVGNSVLAVLLWSATGQHDIFTGWTPIATAAALTAFADGVDNMPRTVRAGNTAIG